MINAALAEELAKRHEVTVLTSLGLDLPEHESVTGVRIIRVPLFVKRRQAAANLPSLLAYIPSGKKQGKKLLTKERFDVINTHFALPSGPVGDALSRFAGIPNVLSVHGGDLYDPSKWTSPHKHGVLRHWIRRIIHKADFVVAQSNNTMENMRNFYSPKSESSIIPLGITRPMDVSASRSEFGFPENVTLLITVGRLVARKAVHQLIETVKSLKSEDAHLVVLGSGPEEQNLKNQATALNLQDRIHFMGHVSETNKIKCLKVADIFVSTSQHEGFGLVFIEAMAQSLPVVCYDFGGQSDFLQDGVTGHLIALNDRDKFVSAVQSLILDDQKRGEIGKSNQLQANDYYIDTCAAKYEEVFNRVIAADARN